MNKPVIPIAVFILLIFGVIVSISGIVGKYAGRTAEMIILGITAGILLILLIIEKNRKE